MLAETQLVMCGDGPVQRQTQEEEIFHIFFHFRICVCRFLLDVSELLWTEQWLEPQREGLLFLDMSFTVLHVKTATGEVWDQGLLWNKPLSYSAFPYAHKKKHFKYMSVPAKKIIFQKEN